jgi:formiminotetrahydrofolate cyclodeaminase
MAAVPPFLDATFARLLDEIAAESPAPAGGSVAAFVTAMAAGLVAMAGRFSRDHWEGARDAVGRAEELRAHVAPLAQADAAAYEEVLTALRLPRDLEPEVRNGAIAHALSRASDIPLMIAEAAADVAELGALVAERGNPNLRADAVTGALMAESAVRATGYLISVNLGTVPGDPRLERSRQLVEAVAATSARALATGP